MKIGVAKHEPKLLRFSEYGGRAAFVGISPRVQFGCILLLFYLRISDLINGGDIL